MKTKVTTTYIARDGKVFDSRSECLEYDNALLRAEIGDREYARREIQRMKANHHGMLSICFREYLDSQRRMLERLGAFLKGDDSRSSLLMLSGALKSYAGWKDNYESGLEKLRHLRNVVKGKEKL